MRILTCIVMWVQFFPPSIEHTKKHKYSQAAETINASFTPFVVTADGALGLEAKTFIRHLADKIGVIWHRSNSEVLACQNAFCCPSCYESVHSWQ